MEFKVGDRVRIKRDCTGCKAGKIYPIHKNPKDGSYHIPLWAWDDSVKGDEIGCGCEDNWELINEKEESQEDKPKSLIKRTMGVIKNLAKSDLTKALEHFEFVNEYGENTNKYRAEVTDYVIEHGAFDKKDFETSLVKAWKKETEK